MEYPPTRCAIIALLVILLAILALPDNANSLQVSAPDTTPPTITYTRLPAPNAYGWNNCPVTIRFIATDTGSGVRGTATYSRIIATEGYDQSVTWSATDYAGNTRTVTVSGINIDMYPPAVLNTIPASGATDVSVDTPITVTFDDNVDPASVVAGLTLWDGDNQVAATASCDATDTVSLAHGTLIGGETYTVIADGVTDLAGNPMDQPYAWTFTTDPAAFVVPDTMPPAITATRLPAANANGWNNGPVTVVFTALDPDSGLATGDTFTRVFDTDGAGQSVTWSATDKAGNTRTVTVDNIYIDTAAPVITGAPVTAANSNGWYKDNVVVHFTASDTGSGLASVTPDITLTAEGASQSVTGTATDLAGNTASVTVGGISIDRTAPAVTSTAPGNGATVVDVNAPITVTFSEKVDPASAIAGLTLWDGNTKLPGTVTYDSANKVATLAHMALSGGKTYTARMAGVKDLAGNPMSATYTWSFSTTAAKAPVYSAAIVSCSIQGPVIAGHCYIFKITVKNTGTVAWPARAGYALVPLGDACLFDKKPMPMYCEAALRPGQQHTFCFCVRAPAQAGTYHLQYQMSYKGTVFGDILTKDIQVTGKMFNGKTFNAKCGTASPHPPSRQCQT